MRPFAKRILCSLLAVCMLSSLLYASAAEQASYYFTHHTATLTAVGDGEIDVLVNVGGTGYMTDIGATLIYIYESTDNTVFEWVATYTSDDTPRMLGSGTTYYDTPVTYQGVVGRYYKAYVEFYAGDSTGYDEDNYTTVACRAIA